MSIHERTTAGRTRWQVKWREDGAQRSRSFDRKGDADAWQLEVKRRQQLGPLALQQLTTDGETLGEWIGGRWRLEHGVTLAQRTRATYATVYAVHIAPSLENVPIRRLTPSRLREWQAERLAAGVSPATIRQARALLSSALRHAAESEVITGNPLSVVRAPKLPRADAVRPMAPTTVEKIRQQLENDVIEVKASQPGQRQRRSHQMASLREPGARERDAALVALLAYAGLRPSEAFALRWEDVGERTIVVQRATDLDGEVKATKTEARRTVRLLEPLKGDLTAWRKSAGAAASKPGRLVFPRANGSAWSEQDYRNWRSRNWRPACERAGIVPVPRPYDLRHSFASLLLAEGRSIHYVAGQLGHGAEMTLRVYGHVIEEFREADNIDAAEEITKARADLKFPQSSPRAATSDSRAEGNGRKR